VDVERPPRPYDRRVRLPIVLDAALAAVLAAASYAGAELLLRPAPEEAGKLALAVGSLDALRVEWWLCVGAAAASVLIRRRLPLAAFVVAAAAIGFLLTHRLVPVPALALAVPIALYALASATPSRARGIAALAVAVAAAWLVMVHRQPTVGDGLADALEAALRGSSVSAAAVPALLLGIAWAAGDNARTRRQHVATLEQRAADLRRERDQRDQLAIAAERARLIRELHDIVAHGIAVMVVQAQGAEAALQRHPDRTAAALANIVATGRASLAEMRRVLGLARREADPDLALEPQPGLGTLRPLLDQVRDAGTPVDLRVEGEPIPLPAGVDLSAYRIVQEGLTNTLKHGGSGAHATVRLAFAGERLEIEVADDGHGSSSAVDGNGLRGIAERVSALGGTVEAGPRASGGFAIRALLPIDLAASGAHGEPGA
jgi:signal transduction histidine kinase